MRIAPFRTPWLPLLAATLASATLACTALGPAGSGGWDTEQRRRELERARAMTAVSERLPERDASASPGSDVGASPRRLDLSEALELADAHNRTMAAARAGVDAAAGDVAMARAALLPVATARGDYTWFSDEQTNTVDAEGLLPAGTEAPVVTVREDDFATARAAVELAIDVSGALRHGLGAAQASYRAESARAWGTRLEEQSQVAAAYFGLLEAERLRDVSARTVALHERQLADATNRYEQGRLTRNEVLVVEVALASSRQRLLRLDNAIASARRRLNQRTGLAVRASTEAAEVAGRPGLPTVDEALAAARDRNPLVQAMLEEVHAADQRLTAARRARFPRFAVGGAYDVSSADILQPNDYASGGVRVEMDLLSLRREGEIARLDAAGRRSRLLLDRTVREVEALVLDSHDRVRERLAAMDAAQVAVGQADENLRIRQVQFDEGRATSEDLLDAAELAARQRATLASALYQAHSRRAELQQLMGRPMAELVQEPATSEAADQASDVPATVAAPADDAPAGESTATSGRESGEPRR